MHRPGPRAPRHLRHLLALVGLTTAVLVGCSSNNTTETSSSTTQAVASSGTTAGSSKATTTTEDEEDSTTTTAKGSKGTAGTGKGSDPDSEFCARMRAADELQKTSSDKTSDNALPTKAETEAFLEEMKGARDAAPDDATASLDTLISAYEEFIEALSKPNPEESAFMILASEANFDAVTKLSAIVVDTCGFALSGEETNGSGSGSGSGSGTGSGTGEGTPTSGYDCSSRERTVEGAEEDPTSISKVQVAVCKANPNAAWMESVMSGAVWASNGPLEEQEWYVGVYNGGGTYDLNSDGALAVCESMATFLEGAGANVVSIKVGTSSKDDASEPDHVLASRTTGACSKT